MEPRGSDEAGYYIGSQQTRTNTSRAACFTATPAVHDAKVLSRRTVVPQQQTDQAHRRGAGCSSARPPRAPPRRARPPGSALTARYPCHRQRVSSIPAGAREKGSRCGAAGGGSSAAGASHLIIAVPESGIGRGRVELGVREDIGTVAVFSVRVQTFATMCASALRLRRGVGARRGPHDRHRNVRNAVVELIQGTERRLMHDGSRFGLRLTRHIRSEADGTTEVPYLLSNVRLVSGTPRPTGLQLPPGPRLSAEAENRAHRPRNRLSDSPSLAGG